MIQSTHLVLVAVGKLNALYVELQTTWLLERSGRRELKLLKEIACRSLCSYFLSVVQKPKSDIGCLTVEIWKLHTDTWAWHNSSERNFTFLWTSDNWSQTPLPKQLITQETNIYALSGNRASDPKSQAAADLCLRPHGHRNRFIATQIYRLSVSYLSACGTCAENPYSDSVREVKYK
jgi:hypothetical protein